MNYIQLIIYGLLTYSTAAYTQTYRWVDENGTISYSQIPPPTGEAVIIKTAPISKGMSREATEQLNQLRQQLEDRREDRQQAKEAQQQAKEKTAKLEQNCVNARANLSKLEGLGNRLYQTSEGEHLRLTEEDRQARIQTARENIEANCNQ